MLATLILQWWFEGKWHEIGWRASTPESQDDLHKHGAALAAHGGRYRLVVETPYGFEVAYEFPEVEVTTEEPEGFVLMADNRIIGNVTVAQARQMVEAMRVAGAPDLAQVFAEGFGFQNREPQPRDADPWGHGRNPLGCCGDRRMHGGPGCKWPGGGEG
jgi:hypothetical protein